MGINEVQPILEDIDNERYKELSKEILRTMNKQELSYLKRIKKDDDKRIDDIVEEFLDQNEIHINELKVLDRFIDFYKSK